MSYRNLILEKKDGYVILTINRPKVLNALSIELVKELNSAIAKIAGDEEIGGIILTGSGEKAFVAGADISELHPLDEKGALEYARRGQEVLMDIENLGIPVIAAVNGFALGGGCELAMACHVRIASEKALFGQPEVKLGVIPGYGGTQRLARLVGKGRALELCMSGNIIDANEAFRIGLVNKVCPPDDLMATAEKLLNTFLTQSPSAVRLVIEAVNEGLEMSLEDAMELEARLFSECASGEDWKEGTKAFMEKRKPEFTGQ